MRTRCRVEVVTGGLRPSVGARVCVGMDAPRLPSPVDPSARPPRWAARKGSEGSAAEGTEKGMRRSRGIQPPWGTAAGGERRSGRRTLARVARRRRETTTTMVSRPWSVLCASVVCCRARVLLWGASRGGTTRLVFYNFRPTTVLLKNIGEKKRGLETEVKKGAF